jgi:hypothetical protein
MVDSLPSVFVIPGNDFLSPEGVKRRVIRQIDAQDRICSGDIAALTQTQTDFTSESPMLQMILCPVIFDTSLFLESISDLPAKSTDYISKFRSRGSAFLHETCHILGQQCEFPSFDLIDRWGCEPTHPIFRSRLLTSAQYSQRQDVLRKRRREQRTAEPVRTPKYPRFSNCAGKVLASIRCDRHQVLAGCISDLRGDELVPGDELALRISKIVGREDGSWRCKDHDWCDSLQGLGDWVKVSQAWFLYGTLLLLLASRNIL